MANSKNPPKHGWFSTNDTTEKTLRRRPTSWRRLRRRCALAQVARRWNASKKVGGSEAIANRDNSQNTPIVYIYSENLSHQEKVGVTQTSSPGKRTSNLKLGGDSDWIAILGVNAVVGPLCPRLTIARMGVTSPRSRLNSPNYYQERCQTNAAYSQLITPTCLSHIHVLYSQHRPLINIKYQPNSYWIVFQLILNSFTIHLSWGMNRFENNCQFSQWARAP